MFGMGIGEILLIIIIAILFLGPDKLPSTMVDIAKFFRQVKGTVNSAKATLEEEMKFSEMKQQALSYKDDLLSASGELERMTDMTDIGSEVAELKNNFDLNSPIDVDVTPPAPKAPEVITFAPKTKQQPKLEFDSENA
jgi:sec-independent protein translocase protein TatB